MKLYLNSWRGIYFFFNLGHSSLIPTFCPMAFSVGEWEIRVGDGGEGGIICVWPSLALPQTLPNAWQKSPPFYDFQQVSTSIDFLPPSPHWLSCSFFLLCLSPMPTLLARATISKEMLKNHAICRSDWPWDDFVFLYLSFLPLPLRDQREKEKRRRKKRRRRTKKKQ